MPRPPQLILLLTALLGLLVGTTSRAWAGPPAGPWVQKPGELWVALDYVHWFADQRFVGAGTQTLRPNGTLPSPGVRVKLGTDTDGAQLTQQLWALTLSLGVYDNLHVYGFLPIVRVFFRDDANPNGFETVGIGDPILGATYRVADFLAFGTDIKIPGSTVPRTTTDIPISEGQVDWTLWERAGAGFSGDGWSGWARLDVGYRLRFGFSEVLPPAEGGNRIFKPGNELLVMGGLGFRPWLDWLAIMLNVEALFGSAGEDHSNRVNLVSALPAREVIEVQPGILVGPLWGTEVAISVGVPVYGRSYPAGIRVFAGVFRSFELWGSSNE